MPTFTAKINYAGHEITVSADDFAELHRALSGIEELHRDHAFLLEKGADHVVCVYRRDKEENEYYGLQDASSRKNVTYGTKREKDLIPFFPKGEKGYYEPEAGRESQQADRAPRPQAPAEENGAPSGDSLMSEVNRLGEQIYDDLWEAQRWPQIQQHYQAKRPSEEQLRRILEGLQKKRLQEDGLPF